VVGRRGTGACPVAGTGLPGVGTGCPAWDRRDTGGCRGWRAAWPRSPRPAFATPVGC